MKLQKLSALPALQKRAIWRKKYFWIVLLAVLLVGGGAGYYFWQKSSTSSQSTTTETTYTSVVQRGDIKVSATGSGVLKAIKSYDLSFPVEGIVSELNVKVGDTVKSGQVLAVLDGAETLQAKVAAAKVALLEAQQALTELQENADVSLATAYQTYVTAQSAYDDAVKTQQETTGKRCSTQVTAKYTAALEKAKEKVNSFNRSDYGSDAYIDAMNDLDTAQANYDYCVSYTSTEKTSAAASVQVAKANLDQAEKEYNALKAGSGIDPIELKLDETKVEQAQANLSDAQEQLDAITLKAPIDGKIVYLASTQGTYVDTSVFITVADMSKPTISVSVDESDMDYLKVGNKATVVFDAIPNTTFTGTVVEAEPQLTSSGNYSIATGLVELDGDAAAQLADKPLGLTGTVTIIDQESDNTLLVPVSALRDLGDSQYAIFVQQSDGNLKMVTVEIGIQTDTFVEIKSGLNEGDVVSTGLTKASSNINETKSSSVQDMQQGGGPMPGGPGMP